MNSINKSLIGVTMATQPAVDGSGPHSSKIKIDFTTVSNVYPNYTMSFQLNLGGQSVISASNLKVLIPSKTFTVGGVKHRRIYGSTLFSATPDGAPFNAGALLPGETAGGACSDETGVFIVNSGINTNDYYIDFTLTDHDGFGVSYDLENNFM